MMSRVERKSGEAITLSIAPRSCVARSRVGMIPVRLTMSRSGLPVDGKHELGPGPRNETREVETERGRECPPAPAKGEWLSPAE